jgi:hypothetical protein
MKGLNMDCCPITGDWERIPYPGGDLGVNHKPAAFECGSCLTAAKFFIEVSKDVLWVRSMRPSPGRFAKVSLSTIDGDIWMWCHGKRCEIHDVHEGSRGGRQPAEDLSQMLE